MPRIKRYAVPAVAASLALAGLALAQPAGATARFATVSGVGGCSSLPGGNAGKALQGTKEQIWIDDLSGCYLNGKIYLWNNSGSDGAADVFIVRDSVEPLDYTVSTPGLSSIKSDAVAQADEAVVGSSDGTSPVESVGVFAPGQMVTISAASAADQSLPLTAVQDLTISHDQIATETAGAAQVLAEMMGSGIKTTAYQVGADSVVESAYDCVEGIRGVLDGEYDTSTANLPTAWPKTSAQWVAFVKAYADYVYQNYKVASTRAACGEVLNAIRGKEGPEESFTEHLIDKTFEGVLDYLHDIGDI
jgi:hypothetical protein